MQLRKRPRARRSRQTRPLTATERLVINIVYSAIGCLIAFAIGYVVIQLGKGS